jgi:hypothetical protein
MAPLVMHKLSNVAVVSGGMAQLCPELICALEGGLQSAPLVDVLEKWGSKRVLPRMRLLEVALGGRVRFMWLIHSTNHKPFCHVWVQKDGKAPTDYSPSRILEDIRQAARAPEGVEPVVRVLQPQLTQCAEGEEEDPWQACYEMGIMPQGGRTQQGQAYLMTGWDSAVRYQQDQRFIVVGRTGNDTVKVTLKAAILAAGVALWDPNDPVWIRSSVKLLKKRNEVKPPLRDSPQKEDAVAVVGLLQLLQGCRPAMV